MNAYIFPIITALITSAQMTDCSESTLNQRKTTSPAMTSTHARYQEILTIAEARENVRKEYLARVKFDQEWESDARTQSCCPDPLKHSYPDLVSKMDAVTPVRLHAFFHNRQTPVQQEADRHTYVFCGCCPCGPDERYQKECCQDGRQNEIAPEAFNMSE